MSKTLDLHTTNLASLAFTVSKVLHDDNSNAHCIIMPDIRHARAISEHLVCFQPELQQRVICLPDWETLAYDALATDNAITAERLQALYQLSMHKTPVLVTTTQVLMAKIIPASFVQKNSFILKVGDTLSPIAFREMMLKKGYTETREVQQVGDFAIRGAILDAYLYRANRAIRAELFDDEIDSIRKLDVESQLSSDLMREVQLLPNQEYTFQDNATLIKERVETFFEPDAMEHPLIKNLLQARSFAGIEYYLPILHEKLNTIWDYLPTTTHFYVFDNWQHDINKKHADIFKRYQTQLQKQLPALTPNALFLELDFLNNKIAKYPNTTIVYKENSVDGSLPDIRIHPHEDNAVGVLKKLTSTHKVTIYAKDTVRLQNIQHSLSAHDNTILKKLTCTIGPITQGFMYHQHKLAVVAENDLLLKTEQSQIQEPTKALLPIMDDWQPGTLLVHRDYGVGKFATFTRIEQNAKQQDFLVLTYANEDKLYVSVNHLHLVNKYVGKSVQDTQLDQLGSKKWSQRKKKAYEACEDLAAQLLENHALQKGSGAPSCVVDETTYTKFCEDFPYQTTPDQQNTIDQVRHDLSHTHTMDRLICGDVGFGKTEVAIRAAFIVIEAGYQVALLTPTTLLASQHFRTFSERLSPYPIHTCLLSRLTSSSQSNKDIADIAQGKMDMVIATHKLLSGKITFKRLGLIIIDEEHRFGVKQKEMINAIKKKAHILSLSATPIPRTLHLALSSVRDMSIIQTAPKNRRAIRTFIQHYDENTVQEAIQRELARGGQVYLLHNDIQQHAKIQENIEIMLPNVRITNIHGRLNKAQLEATMIAFANQMYDVLICTTIVESGIDIPNANTIIMHRADKLGLSQIHQLKGRVGRSNQQAYAYLLTPDEKLMTKDAQARMHTIKKHQGLGAGYFIATEDLEIRGAGDLLGSKQTGHMQQIGMDMYVKLLRKAQYALRNEHNKDTIKHTECEIETSIDTTIPDTYILDIVTRLRYYRKIRLVENKEELQSIQNELQDKFGLLPKSVSALCKQRLLNLQLEKYQITKTTIYDKKCIIYAQSESPLNPQKMLAFAKEHGYRMAFLPQQKVQISHNEYKAEQIQNDIVSLFS